MGLCPVPLRPLGLAAQQLVLDAWPLRGSPGLRAGSRRLGGWVEPERLDHGGPCAHRRLVPVGAARGLRAWLPREPPLCAQCQRDAGDQHHQHQRHEHRQQPRPRDGRHALRQPPSSACGDGSPGIGGRAAPTGGPGHRNGERSRVARHGARASACRRPGGCTSALCPGHAPGRRPAHVAPGFAVEQRRLRAGRSGSASSAAGWTARQWRAAWRSSRRPW